MKTKWKLWCIFCTLLAVTLPTDARIWSLQACIDFALHNNTNMQKMQLNVKNAHENIRESEAALLPSLSFNTSHNVSYTPWPEVGSYMVAGSRVQTSVDKTFYNGSYGVSANLMLWNGNRNRNQIKLNQYAEKQAMLDSATTANTLIEQITQLYVQILYSTEAIKVNQESLATSTKNEDRGQEMLNVGKMSKANLAQLTAQRAQDEYAVVQAESALKDYKRQLKQLLQLTNNEPFEIVIPQTTDDMALALIPQLNNVYQQAVAHRPEIKNAELGIESSNLSIKIAKAMRQPTISLNAGANANTTTMSHKAWGTQLKNNFGIGAGVSISIPLFDNRQTTTAINKARLQQLNYQLELKDKQTILYSTIESYWLQAYNNQNMFKAAQVTTQSAKTSYALLNEQFCLGLKNIVDLMTGKDNLLKAQQNELQSKYLAILNIKLLQFYQEGTLK
nr:TolC family protein [uncultured Prevotella sp.]